MIRRKEGEPVRDIMEAVKRCAVIDVAEMVREARLRWYGYEIRRDKGAGQ